MALRWILVASLCCSGCLIAKYEEGASVAEERVAEIVPGKTTKAQILDWFGAPQGLERVRGLHPDVRIWTAAIDATLDQHGYIVPGLGDAGDRAYGTK